MSKILLIDDSPFICNIIETILTGEGYVVAIAHTGVDAIEVVRAETPDLILLDIILPRVSGYEICKILKENRLTKEIPIVFITSASDDKSVVNAFSAGGVDYISKPFKPVELLARVLVHVKNKEMRDLLKAANDELARTNQALAETLAEKHLWAIKDSLTSLYNRYYFMEKQPIWEKQAASGEKLSVILADVDNFKRINDQHGHFVGDYVLRTIAHLMLECCGTGSTVVRWGGEEFVALFQSDAVMAISQAEKLRQMVAKHRFRCDELLLSCTITIGVRQIDPRLSLEKNLAIADEAMYEGKQAGKNRVVVR